MSDLIGGAVLILGLIAVIVLVLPPLTFGLVWLVGRIWGGFLTWVCDRMADQEDRREREKAR